MSDRRGFDRIIGQELAKRVLVRAVSDNEPTHAYLFLGLQGTGKTTTALEFAKALNCEDPKDGHACGYCGICRAIKDRQCADVLVWGLGQHYAPHLIRHRSRSKLRESSQETTIDQMREMKLLSSLKPNMARWKINIVEQADTLNEESANSILKLIEEPPDYVVNILLYRNAAAILPTIRSRCQLVRFTQVPTDELARRLVEDYRLNEKESLFLATYSQGRPGIAIGLVGNDEFFGRRNAIAEVAGSASSGNPWLALKLAEVLRSTETTEEEDEAEAAPAYAGVDSTARSQKPKSKRDIVLESLDVLLVWYRDLLAARLQGAEAAVVNCDRVEEIAAQASRYRDARRLAEIVDAIVRAKRGILGNANAQIQTEALMMRLTT